MIDPNPNLTRRRVRAKVEAECAVGLAERACEKHHDRNESLRYAVMRCTSVSDRDLAILRLLHGGVRRDLIASHMRVNLQTVARIARMPH